MKKKAIVLLIIAVLAITPAMAAPRGSSSEGSVGVGLNLGTNTGLGLKFDMGKFDILANIGLMNFNIGADGFNLGTDVAVSYEVYDFDLGGEHHMPLTLGLGAVMGFDIGKTFGFDLGLVVPVGIEYKIPDFPMSFYLRLAPGIGLVDNSSFRMHFAFAGYIGALWVFE